MTDDESWTGFTIALAAILLYVLFALRWVTFESAVAGLLTIGVIAVSRQPR